MREVKQKHVLHVTFAQLQNDSFGVRGSPNLRNKIYDVSKFLLEI